MRCLRNFTKYDWLFKRLAAIEKIEFSRKIKIPDWYIFHYILMWRTKWATGRKILSYNSRVICSKPSTIKVLKEKNYWRSVILNHCITSLYSKVCSPPYYYAGSARLFSSLVVKEINPRMKKWFWLYYYYEKRIVLIF